MSELFNTSAVSPARGGLLSIFRPAPPAAVIATDPREIAAKYSRWQLRVLIFATLGYATFYLVRKNYSVVQPIIGADLGISKKGLGLILTLHGIVYGISKFLNGFLADRSNAAVFMSTALIASALLNVCFGLSSSLVIFILLWMANGWFQGMGFPPCARLMANWFPPKELATKFSIWNSSHNIGSIGILLLGGFLVTGTFFGQKLFAPNWRMSFFIPAAIALIIAAIVWFMLPDTPPSVGLPEVAGTESPKDKEEKHGDFKAFVGKKVFGNKYIWMLSIANFFVYAMRYAVFDWGTTILKEAKHIEIADSKWMLAGFEVFGFLGAMLGGWLSDKFLGGRTVRACVVYMALAGVSVLLFWKIPAQSRLVTTGLLCATGFFVYGPQCLLAIACANLATKRAAATAVGLTSIFGYASTTLSGVGLGALVDKFGWDAGFGCIIACSVIGTVLFILAWPAKAHGYKE